MLRKDAYYGEQVNVQLVRNAMQPQWNSCICVYLVVLVHTYTYWHPQTMVIRA